MRKSKSEDGKVAFYYEDVHWNHDKLCGFMLGIIECTPKGFANK